MYSRDAHPVIVMAKKTTKKAKKPRPQSTAPSGALRLHGDGWRHVFEYVECGRASLDDLARMKAVGRLLVTSKSMKNLLARLPDRFWAPLVEVARRVAPCVAAWKPKEEVRASPWDNSHVGATQRLLAEKPWLPLTALADACVHCRRAKPPKRHAVYKVLVCKACCSKKTGLVTKTGAKGEYRVTDKDLAALPYVAGSWYGKESRHYLIRQVKLLQAKRFGTKAAFDKVDATRKPYDPGHVPFYNWW